MEELDGYLQAQVIDSLIMDIYDEDVPLINGEVDETWIPRKKKRARELRKFLRTIKTSCEILEYELKKSGF